MEPSLAEKDFTHWNATVGHSMRLDPTRLLVTDNPRLMRTLATRRMLEHEQNKSTVAAILASNYEEVPSATVMYQPNGSTPELIANPRQCCE